jgi:hypothetical protein
MHGLLLLIWMKTPSAGSVMRREEMGRRRIHQMDVLVA